MVNEQSRTPAEAGMQENDLWQMTIQEDSIESYQHYLTIFPHGKKADKATSLIKHYELVYERQTWEEAKSKNTIYHLKKYLQGSRLKTYANEAATMLVKLEVQNEKPGEAAVPESSVAKNTSYTAASSMSNSTTMSRFDKIKFYTILFAIPGILVLFSILLVWKRSMPETAVNHAGLDSVTVSQTNSTKAVMDTIEIKTFAKDEGKEDGLNSENNSSSKTEGENSIKETQQPKIETSVITTKPDVEKGIGKIIDSAIPLKLAPTHAEPEVIKDSTPAKPVFKGPLKIPVGLQISVILDEPLSSEDMSKHATEIKLHCSQDVEFDGQTIIAKGAPAVGRVVEVYPSVSSKHARIGFVIQRITAADGSIIQLDSQRYRKVASESGKAVSYTDGLVFYAKLKKR